MTPNPRFTLSTAHTRWALGLITAGAAALAWGLLRDPSRAWANVLVGNFYLLSLGLAALFFIAINHLTSSSWWVALRRIPEAMIAIIPVMIVPMLLLYFGRHDLYHWSHPNVVHHDPILAGKSPWLNTGFFFARMAFFLGIWTLFAHLIRRQSLKQDTAPGEGPQLRMNRLSAIFIPIFAISLSLASFDWLMSIEPHWYSTIFAIYTFSGLFLHGLAVIALIATFLIDRGYLENVINENHLHDLSKLILAFSTFWVCMWVNQYMLIWYSNIPEETSYYILRTNQDWHWLFMLNIVVNWVVPFLILVMRRAKRSTSVLKKVCCLLVVGHWIDLYLMVTPAVVKTRGNGILELLIALGYGALFFLVTSLALSRAPLVARNDPYLEESLHHHQ